MSVERLSADQVRAAADFVREVMFKPWQRGACGPDAYDCWGLARAAQARLAGRDLPILNIDPNDLRAVIRLVQNHPLRDEWRQVDMPRHLDLVMMAHRQHPHHAGTWLAVDGGMVLHAAEQFRRAKGADGKPTSLPDARKPGVSADSLLSLKQHGWACIQFWRYPGAM